VIIDAILLGGGNARGRKANRRHDRQEAGRSNPLPGRGCEESRSFRPARKARLAAGAIRREQPAISRITRLSRHGRGSSRLPQENVRPAGPGRPERVSSAWIPQNHIPLKNR
jgi:hypothetical protein